jgi:hypothetical protein
MENIEVTVDELISGVDNIECKIDEDELNQLLELCKAEYPHIPEYFHYVYSVDYLMNN